MSLNDIPSSQRIHIGFFGRCNSGKSQIVNALTNQELSIVSNVSGTTTDPVKKAVEINPLGPVVIIDTAGLDDNTSLGTKRIERTKKMLDITDIAVIVIDANKGISDIDNGFIDVVKNQNKPYLIAYNKVDLSDIIPASDGNAVYLSAKTGFGIDNLKNAIIDIAKSVDNSKKIIADKLNPKDIVILVTPIDESAPKQRLILPQQQTIRDILDINAIPIEVRETELEYMLSSLKIKPKLVITDSKIFDYVSKIVPKDILLTSFSILFANYKGNLKTMVKGAEMLDKLTDNDKVLIAEACTHHRQCNDIGSIKLPKMIKNYTKKNINFEFASGNDFPNDLKEYSLIIHCGGCMITQQAMKSRLNKAKEQNVPITNYGICFAKMNGILDRSIEIFPELL